MTEDELRTKILGSLDDPVSARDHAEKVLGDPYRFCPLGATHEEYDAYINRLRAERAAKAKEGRENL